MKCDEVRDLLDDYQGGQLDKEQEGLVAWHLNSCAECRSELETLRAEQRFLQEHLRPECPPAEVRQRLDAVLTRPASSRGEGAGWTRWALRRAAGVLLAVGVTIVVQSRRRTEPIQAPAAPAPSAERDPEVAQLLAEIEMLTARIEAASQPIRWDDQMGRFPLLTAELCRSDLHLVQQAREGLAAQQLAVASQRNAVGDIAGSQERREFVTACLLDTAVGSGSVINRERSKP